MRITCVWQEDGYYTLDCIKARLRRGQSVQCDDSLYHETEIQEGIRLGFIVADEVDENVAEAAREATVHSKGACAGPS